MKEEMRPQLADVMCEYCKMNHCDGNYYACEVISKVVDKISETERKDKDDNCS